MLTKNTTDYQQLKIYSKMNVRSVIKNINRGVQKSSVLV